MTPDLPLICKDRLTSCQRWGLHEMNAVGAAVAKAAIKRIAFRFDVLNPAFRYHGPNCVEVDPGVYTILLNHDFLALTSGSYAEVGRLSFQAYLEVPKPIPVPSWAEMPRVGRLLDLVKHQALVEAVAAMQAIFQLTDDDALCLYHTVASERSISKVAIESTADDDFRFSLPPDRALISARAKRAIAAL